MPTLHSWQDYAVFAWPHKDARSILVADAGRLFGRNDLHGQPGFLLEVTPADEAAV